MDLWQQTKDWLENVRLEREGDPVIAMVSGGPDSMWMLTLLEEVWPKNEIHVLHINHLYRPSSHRELAFVRHYAMRKGFSFHYHTDSMRARALYDEVSLEMAGRLIREEALANVKKEFPTALVAKGHHREDQVETVLMRILRGTGPEGLVGMSPWDHEVIRPLFLYDKEKILESLKQRGIPYVEDESNAVADVMRNRLRLETLPHLREAYGTGVDEALLRLSRLALADKLFWQQYVEERKNGLLRETPEGIYVHRMLYGMPPAVSTRMIRYALASLGDFALENVGLEHVTRILDQLAMPGSWELQLPGNVRAFGVGSEVLLRKGEWPLAVPQEMNLQLGVNLTSWGIFYVEQQLASPSSHVIVLDEDRLPGDLRLRTRREGDIFYPQGMTGSKKIKHYMIDEKIPAPHRDQKALLVAGEDVLWVVGHRKDRRYLADETTTHPLTVTFKEVNHERTM